MTRIRTLAKFFFEGDRKFFVKGVTCGPFKPDAEGHYLGTPDKVDVDLALMRQIGINLVRIYHAPPRATRKPVMTSSKIKTAPCFVHSWRKIDKKFSRAK